jgi:hypothetical protein
VKFTELLQEHHIPTAPEGHHHARPGWVQFDCPFCAGRGARKWHMGYNIAFGYVNCWRCGRHHLTETLESLLGMEGRDVRKVLTEVELDRSVPRQRKRGRLLIPPCVGALEAPHRRYLKTRRFDPARVARLWDIGGIGLRGTPYGLQHRIFIPIHQYGEVVSWTTRSISDKVKKKYRTAKPEEESVSHKSILYGADYCRGTALVFEGPPDVWKVGPGAVCTFGTQWSDAQLDLLSKFPRRVVCFDSEVVAQERAQAMINKLALLDGETYNMVIHRKGRDLNEDEVAEIRRKWL